MACLHNGNPAKQQLDELSAPAGQNKKAYAQKNNLLTTFSSGLGLSPRCLRQLHTPKVKRKVPVFAGTLLVACVAQRFSTNRVGQHLFSNLRVILRGCRFAPLRSPFIGLGAFAPLPSATPYPEGKKKGTCFCRYLIGCGGRI